MGGAGAVGAADAGVGGAVGVVGVGATALAVLGSMTSLLSMGVLAARFHHARGLTEKATNDRLDGGGRSEKDDVGIDVVSGTAADADSAAATFDRKHAIRQHVRNALMGMQARRRITESLIHRAEKSKIHYPGQWVYVWRRVRGRTKSHV